MRRSPRDRRSQTVAAVAAVVTVLLLAGCGRDGAGLIPVSPPAEPSGAAGATATGAGTVGVTQIPQAQRQPAPDISGDTLQGGRFSVAEQAGRVVVLNSWASWCAPCRDELPSLRETYDGTSRRDVVFAGLDVNDAPDAARSFAAETGMVWPSIVDPDGALLATIPGVPPRALPSTVVIDRQGRIAARIVGPVKPGVLTPLVDRLVDERG